MYFSVLLSILVLPSPFWLRWLRTAHALGLRGLVFRAFASEPCSFCRTRQLSCDCGPPVVATWSAILSCWLWPCANCFGVWACLSWTSSLLLHNRLLAWLYLALPFCSTRSFAVTLAFGPCGGKSSQLLHFTELACGSPSQACSLGFFCAIGQSPKPSCGSHRSSCRLYFLLAWVGWSCWWVAWDLLQLACGLSWQPLAFDEGFHHHLLHRESSQSLLLLVEKAAEIHRCWSSTSRQLLGSDWHSSL